ncbi:MAG: M14 family metallopeptidase [Wenzhouxiangellaceae bacterium]
MNALMMLRRLAALPGLLSLSLTAALAQTALPGLDELSAPDGLTELLGFEPGERHPMHHELVAFYDGLAQRSDRVAVERIGRTHGGREQILVYFARPDRIATLPAIRDGRIDASRRGEGPAVVWLGYSVHGNEASGASGAVIAAWLLAMSDDSRVRRWLDELVIVMEPAINPDGLDRFARWVNDHRGRHPSADPNDREHNEGWPNGRTNYYWFDLNRDWLPLTHPVSRNRLRHYHLWRPHLLTDAHEMGPQASYFFQPGVPERNNPATPAQVHESTAKIADYHSRVLDAAGQPHFARERFDDYYPGKGSTYPDLTGGIGILFEQGTARGHRIETPWGERRFADAIANQVRTTISTLEAAADLDGELIEQQRRFFTEARAEAGSGGWVLGDDGDPARAARLLGILLGHRVEVRPLSEPLRVDGRRFEPGHAWVIPARQDQRRLIESLFEVATELPMERFYDVSTWPLQHAFDLPLVRVRRLPASGAVIESAQPGLPEAFTVDQDALAWSIDWRQHHAPTVLAALLARGYRVQVLEKAAQLDHGGSGTNLGPGSLIVHRATQPEALPPVADLLQELAREHAVRIEAVQRGLSVSGPDLGSPSAPVLDVPVPLLLTGNAVSPYDAGEVWHWFDQTLGQPVTRIDAHRLPDDLSRYTHIIIAGAIQPPHGLGETIADFVRSGGTLVAIGGAARWAEQLELDWQWTDDDAESASRPDSDSTGTPRRYADFEADHARTLIGGSALAVVLDTSHPLGWGYERDRITLFRQGAHRLRTSANPYATPGRYAEPVLVSGYLADDLDRKLAGGAALAADRIGRGLVIRIADDVLFRGYWAGAEKIFANALFFSQRIAATRLPD